MSIGLLLSQRLAFSVICVRGSKGLLCFHINGLAVSEGSCIQYAPREAFPPREQQPQITTEQQCDDHSTNENAEESSSNCDERESSPPPAPATTRCTEYQLNDFVTIIVKHSTELQPLDLSHLCKSNSPKRTQLDPPSTRVNNEIRLSDSTTLTLKPRGPAPNDSERQSDGCAEDPLKEAATAVAKHLGLLTPSESPIIAKEQKSNSSQMTPVKLRWKNLIANAKASHASKAGANKIGQVPPRTFSERIRKKQLSSNKQLTRGKESPAPPKKNSRKKKRKSKPCKKKEEVKKIKSVLVSVTSVVEQFKSSQPSPVNPPPLVSNELTEKKEPNDSSKKGCSEDKQENKTAKEVENNNVRRPSPSSTPSVIVKVRKNTIEPVGVSSPPTVVCGEEGPERLDTSPPRPTASSLQTPSTNYTIPHDYGRNNICPKCKKVYSRWDSLKRHLDYQCGIEMRCACPHCSFKTHFKCNLKRHVQRMHPYASPINDNDSSS